MSTNTTLSTREDFGLPPPPPPSTALWSYLLKNDSSKIVPHSQCSAPSLPPTTPLDRNATSMRILLHDTQANFEQFSAQVVQLISNVNEAKQEIKTTKNLFEREHETLSSDMIDLVNRSQTQIQKSLGTPSQASELEQLRKDVDRRLESLDQRLDVIQMFNQTHSQALQTQIQALQSLQDQQLTILTAVMPLLPLLQAVPLHIESAQKNLMGPLEKLSTAAFSAHTTWYPRRTSALPRKRAHPASHSDDTSSSPLSNTTPPEKKARIFQESTTRKNSNTQTPSHPLEQAQPGQIPIQPESLQTALTSSPTSAYPPQKLTLHKLTNTPRLRAPSSSIAVFPSCQSSNAVSARKPSLLTTITPRRPLADIFMSVVTPANQKSLKRTPSLSRSSTHNLDIPPASKGTGTLGLGPESAKPPPRMLRVYASLPRRISSSTTTTSNAGTQLASIEPDSRADDSTTDASHDPPPPSASRPQPQLGPPPPPFPAPSSEPTPQFTLTPAPAASRSVTPAGAPAQIPPWLQRRSTRTATTHVEASGRSNMPPPSAQPTLDSRARDAALNLKAAPTAISMSIGQRKREKQSPFREGRRFIPLVDSDDSDDNSDRDGFGEMLTRQ